MSNVTTIGLDIAKSLSQIHGVDAGGEVVVRRKLSRPSNRTTQGERWPTRLARRTYAQSRLIPTDQEIY